jgi:hypothetical protein
VDRYEQLLQRTLAGDATGWRCGLAILHYRGVVAWLHAWRGLVPIPAQASAAGRSPVTATPGVADRLGAFAVSWIAGFVFVLAPAGAGVREAIMVALLGTTMSPATALIPRLMLTLGDVILGGLALAAICRALRTRMRLRRDEVTASGPPVPNSPAAGR